MSFATQLSTISTVLVELVAYSFLRFGGLAVPNPVRLGYSGKGSLSVAITDQVALVAVPPGSQRVPLLTLEVTADCGGNRQVQVESVNLRHSGLGSMDDIAGVYALYRNARVSRARTIGRRDGVLALPLRGVTVPACTSETLQILADFLPGAAIAGQHRLSLDGDEPVVADSAVILSTRPAPARRAVPATTRGALSVEALSVPGHFSVGERQAVAAFRFHAEGRAQYIVRITITNQGTAHDADVRDFQLEAGSTAVTPVVSTMQGDQVTFTLDPPLAISRNSDRIVNMYGTPVGGTGRSLKFVIEEPSDVIAGR